MTEPDPNPPSYKYDVAFSFLAQDELIVAEVNGLLKDRLKTFFYADKQEEIAGTDGELSFGRVFGEEARSVVVFYREGWGKTSWTRIEETAIRNRAHDSGYDFALFVPLGEKPSVPPWLPKNRIWIGLERWKATGAAIAIEARVQDLGGEVHEETNEARAAKIQESFKFKALREKYLESDQAAYDAAKEFECLREEIAERIPPIREAMGSTRYNVKQDYNHFIVEGNRRGLSFIWCIEYSNSLTDTRLEVTVWNKSHPPFPNIMHRELPRKLESLQFDYDLTRNRRACWKSREDEALVETSALADQALKLLLDAEMDAIND